MFSKVVIFAVVVILAAPIYAAAGGGGGGGGGGSGGGGGGGHGGGGGGGGHGGGGGGGHGGGAYGGAGHSGGLSGRAAAATARSGVYGHDLSDRAGISRADAMHATHQAGDKHSEVERTSFKSPSMDHHSHPYRREPKYGHGVAGDQTYFPLCIAPATFDCNVPTKSRSGHK
jgi:hypothetical protein